METMRRGLWIFRMTFFAFGLFVLIYGTISLIDWMYLKNKEHDDLISGTGEKVNEMYDDYTDVKKIGLERANIFQTIYMDHKWHFGSGSGSTETYTKQLRCHLYYFVLSHNLTSMADIPCGVMNWTTSFLKSVWKVNPNFRYIGIDITESVVQKMTKKWKHEDRVNIFRADLVSSILNLDVDFIFNRDVLQHMPLKDACRAVNNLIDAGKRYKYLVIGSYPSAETNIDIMPGKYYSVNIMKPPFNFPQPYIMFREKKDQRRQKHILIYQRDDIQKYKCEICKEYIKRLQCSN